jgi:uncharacterized protein YndB with AHSA1/START domain
MNQALGDLERVGDAWKVRYTRTLAHPPEKVWRSLTEPEHLRAWFPTDIEGDWSPGSKLRFVFREDEGPDFDGEVLAVEPPRLLELRWGDEVLRFELQPTSEGTALTFVVTFDDVGKAARDGAGWHQCLDLLGHELDGRTPQPDAKESWKPLFELYKERFGPEASAIGPPEGMG